MQVTIAKIDEVLYEGEADSLTVPGSAGEMTVLTHHEPLITTLKSGRITVRASGEEKMFDITEGVLEISPHGATVIL